MDRLNDQARHAVAAGRLAALNQDAGADAERRAAQAARLAPELDKARRLLPKLAGLFISLASQTRAEAGAAAWIDVWARQIYANLLTDSDLARGLAGIAEVMVAAGNPPFSFPLFLQACRPDGHMTGLDAEARKPHPLLLTRDLSKDQAWCANRDAAWARLGRGKK